MGGTNGRHVYALPQDRGRSRGLRGPGGVGGVRAVEGGARRGRQAVARPVQREDAHLRARREAYTNRGADVAVIVAVAVAVVCALCLGQACQLAYSHGRAAGYASGVQVADQQQYDRGYSAAVYEYREGVAEWASE